MSVFDQARIIVYRCHEKGLEVLLLNTGRSPEDWCIPNTEIPNKTHNLDSQHSIIELEPTTNEDGTATRTFAIEGDFHDIPSIRKMIKNDVAIVKYKIKNKIPEFEKGSYFAMKEAFKKILPNEYEMLHELKEIIMDRNLIRNI